MYIFGTFVLFLRIFLNLMLTFRFFNFFFLILNIEWVIIYLQLVVFSCFNPLSRFTGFTCVLESKIPLQIVLIAFYCRFFNPLLAMRTTRLMTEKSGTVMASSWQKLDQHPVSLLIKMPYCITINRCTTTKKLTRISCWMFCDTSVSRPRMMVPYLSSCQVGRRFRNSAFFSSRLPPFKSLRPYALVMLFD